MSNGTNDPRQYRRLEISSIIGENSYHDDDFFAQSFEKAFENKSLPTTKEEVIEHSEEGHYLPMPPGMNPAQRIPSVSWKLSGNGACKFIPSVSQMPIQSMDPNQWTECYQSNSIRQEEDYEKVKGGGGFNSFSTSQYHSMPAQLFNWSDMLDKRQRSQERNRLAAMKSRQRKKKEWERLLQVEASLMDENAKLKQELSRLQEELRSYKEGEYVFSLQ